MDSTTLKKVIENEKQLLYQKYWKKYFVNPLPVVPIVRNHRFRKDDVEIILKINNLEKLKDKIKSKIGITIPFLFLSLTAPICGELDSPYSDLDTYLLILYQLLCGNSNKEMEEFIPSSTFGFVYISFWKKHINELNTLSDDILKNWYSTPKLRISGANLANPQDFLHVTVMGDGHDNRIDYSDKTKLKFKNRQLISYKLKRTSSRTQVFIDSNNLPIYISDTTAPNTPDGIMVKESKLYSAISKTDCIGLDCGYYLYKDDIIKQFDTNGLKLESKNFFFPIRKRRNIELEEDENDFIKKFGSFRSRIETTFAQHQELFNFF
jgi:hypothetical protein